MQYDSDELVLFLLHIRKTLSMKKKILESITSIKTQETRDIITNIYINNKLPDEYALYNTLLLH